MKKTILLLAILSLVFVSVEAKEKKEKKSKKTPVIEKVFNNDVDSMSYALGINVGTDFAKNLQGIPGGKSNIDLLIKGFATAMKGEPGLMTTEFANEYFREYITEAQTKEVEAKKAEGEKFLAENKTKEGVKTTSSGLQYQFLVSTEGAKPRETDTVLVHYQGFLLDGTKFDSSIDRGEPISFPLNGVIPGWTEGVQLMSVGSKIKLFVPSYLAYAEKGAGNVIPPYATLIFEVELLDIKPFVEAPSIIELQQPETPLIPVTKKPAKPAKKSSK
jgi:FKBP-type peptidyl-prolyl cis-trans isomerase